MSIVVKDDRPRRTQAEEIPPLDLKRYLNLVRKRRVLFASVAAAIITAAFIISNIIPPVYEAQTLVAVEDNVLTDITKGLTNSPSSDAKASALATMMKSRALISKVISDLDLDVDRGRGSDIEDLIKSIQLRTEVKVELNKGRGSEVDFFTVSFQDRDPKVARDYVNTLVGRYIEESLRFKREESKGVMNSTSALAAAANLGLSANCAA